MIKEYCVKNNTAVIMDDNYGSSLAKFDILYDTAKFDFPTLQREDVRVEKYGGNRRKRMFGIEFSVPDGCQEIAKQKYSTIDRLEETL